MKRITTIIFLLAVLVLCLSTFTAYKRISAVVSIPETVASMNEPSQNLTPIVKEEATVLGTSDKMACASQEEFLKAITRTRPEIAMSFNTDEQVLTSEQLLSCSSLSSGEVTSQGCTSYRITLSNVCVGNLLRSTAQFQQTTEEIRNPISHMTVSARIIDEVVDYELLAEKIVDIYQENTEYAVVTERYAIMKPLQIIVPVIKDLPNTKGDAANRYLEFDGSRQLLFMWENGKYKRYRMSGAFPEYNPVGVFTILNKSPLAWSSTANKWMPYWQAFTFDKKQKAMLGIHALVYWYAGFEKTGPRKFLEPESNIGKPRSTGCLRLTLEDAKKVYEWSRIGDMVVIHD